MKTRLPFNGLVLQKVYSLCNRAGREIAQVQASNVTDALRIGQQEHGEECRCAFLLPQRKEARFQK